MTNDFIDTIAKAINSKAILPFEVTNHKNSLSFIKNNYIHREQPVTQLVTIYTDGLNQATCIDPCDGKHLIVIPAGYSQTSPNDTYLSRQNIYKHIIEINKNQNQYYLIDLMHRKDNKYDKYALEFMYFDNSKVGNSYSMGFIPKPINQFFLEQKTYEFYKFTLAGWANMNEDKFIAPIFIIDFNRLGSPATTFVDDFPNKAFPNKAKPKKGRFCRIMESV